MHKLKAALFIIGFLIELSAFFGDHAEDVPFILKRVSPTYWRAKQAIETLESKYTITPNDTGFIEISNILAAKLHIDIEGSHDSKLSKAFHLESFILHKGLIAEGDGVFRHVQMDIVPDAVTHLARTNGKIAFPRLQKDVEELKSVPIFKFCLIIFLIGATVQFFAFFFVDVEPPGQEDKSLPNTIGIKVAGMESQNVDHVGVSILIGMKPE